MKKKLNVGMIGCGFMGRVHSNAYRRVPNFFDVEYEPVLKAVCDQNEERLKNFADTWGYESTETDWRKLIERADVDVVEICVPNFLHNEIAIAAAEQGKMVITEKPLARTGAEGEPMVAAVEKAGVHNTVTYNYRRLPAVSLAKQLIDEGKLGKIFHYRANFLQDWTISPDVPQGGKDVWRLDVNAAGSGVLGDLLAHCIDTAIWLNGSISSLSGMTETFVKERQHTETGKVEPVGIDDACTFMCRFENGSLGLFESTRYARGHKALYTFEINGEHASIRWDLHNLQWLEWFDHNVEGRQRGWSAIHVTDPGDHPYMDRYWVPGLIIGFEHSFVHHVADFLQAVAKGEPCHPTFRDALETQKVCDSVQKSAKSGAWENV